MDDISREPRVENRPQESRAPKGPAEISVDEACTIDEVAFDRGVVTADRDRGLEPLRVVPLNAETDRMQAAEGDATPVDSPAGEEAPIEPAQDALVEPPPEDVSDGEASAAQAPDVQLEDEQPEGEHPEDAQPDDELADAAADAEVVGGVDSVDDDGEAEEEVAPVADGFDAGLPDEDELPAIADTAELARVVLALLLATREGVSVIRLAEVCGSTQKAVKEALSELTKLFDHDGLPLELSQSGDKVKVLTRPVVYPFIKRLKGLKKAAQLSPAALETLAVIAYRQPVIRAEIESIRGVKAGPMLRSLLEHKLVKVVGRADVPGRPLQYGTTQIFLERFGLDSLKELPSIQEFKSLG